MWAPHPCTHADKGRGAFAVHGSVGTYSTMKSKNVTGHYGGVKDVQAVAWIPELAWISDLERPFNRQQQLTTFSQETEPKDVPHEYSFSPSSFLPPSGWLCSSHQDDVQRRTFIKDAGLQTTSISNLKHVTTRSVQRTLVTLSIFEADNILFFSGCVAFSITTTTKIFTFLRLLQEQSSH